MEPQQLSGPQVTRPTTDTLSKRNALYPLQGECMLMPKNNTPLRSVHQMSPLKKYQVLPLVVASRKIPQTTWRRRVH